MDLYLIVWQTYQTALNDKWDHKKTTNCSENNLAKVSAVQMTLLSIKKKTYSTESRHLSLFEGTRIRNEHLLVVPGLPLVNASQLITK